MLFQTSFLWLAVGPLAGVDLGGGAGHVDISVGFAPFEGEVSPGEVRVHGDGTQLVCRMAEENEGFAPCWSPPRVSGFRDAYAQAAASIIRPEWDPDTGVLAYLEGPGRFVFLDPMSGERTVLDAAAMLSAYRP